MKIVRRVPIQIEKVLFENDNMGSVKQSANYLITISEKGQNWEKSMVCTQEALEHLKEEIEKVIGTTTIAQKLGISEEDAKKVDKYHRTDILCKNCKYKMKHNCVTCLFTLDSPLERKLYLALLDNYINFQTQWALNHKGESISTEGKSYDNPDNNYKDVLTVADFFIEKKGKRLCIYTDGHSYHERTEDQAKHDRNIDRSLQELGYQVLRYTGKEINENVNKVVRDTNKMDRVKQLDFEYFYFIRIRPESLMRLHSSSFYLTQKTTHEKLDRKSKRTST